MSPIEERNKIITEIIAPEFKKAGFKKLGNNYSKTEDRFIKVFSLENSVWNEKDWVSFSLDIGFIFPIAYEIQNKPIPRNIPASSSHFSIKSYLIDGFKRVIEITPETDINELRTFIYNFTTDFVFPFFNKFNKFEDCKKLLELSFWETNNIKPFIGLTLLEKGNLKEGIELLKDVDLSYYSDTFKELLIKHSKIFQDRIKVTPKI